MNIQNRTMKHTLLLILPILLLLASCLPANVEPTIVPVASGLTLQLDPNAGDPGTEVTVIGIGWSPNAQVQVYFEQAGSSRRAKDVITTVTDDQGRFQTIVTSPTGLLWRTRGNLVVTARAEKTGQQVSTLFTNLSAPSDATPDPALALTPLAATATPIPAGYTASARVITYALNVRQGPGTNYSVLTSVKQGDELTVLGQDATSAWLRVRLSDGVEGWVARAYTDFTGTMSVVSAGTIPLPLPLPSALIGWKAEYFGNRDLSGAPVLVRQDARLSFVWGNGSPSALVPADNFSARWTRTLTLPAGNYLFSTRADDGVRVWLDNNLIIDRWQVGSAETSSVAQELAAGPHTLRIEYFDAEGVAQMQFWWQRTGNYPDWRGEYYANSELSGAPALVRNDKQIAFNWGAGVPDNKLPENRFSARWTRTQLFEEGLYRFTLQADDGVRLYIDGTLILDAWQEGLKKDLTVDYKITAGFHSVRLEYYENGGDALVSMNWARTTTYPDWLGQYWSNRNQQGEPALVRNDIQVDFNWGGGSPSTIPADNFSARWSRAQHFEAGTYRFHLMADDGARLILDGNLLIDAWQDGGGGDLTVETPLAAGPHTLQVDYYERSGDARVRLWWELVLSPFYPDWKGEYFANATLSGAPALTRNDRSIDFTWNTQAPAPGLPTDGFSARWSRTVDFVPGVYRLFAQSDDGIRVFVNGAQALNAWRDQSSNELHSADLTLSGSTRIVVEYYENSGGARALFQWNRLGDAATAVPTATTVPAATATTVPAATATTVPAATATTAPAATATTVPPTATTVPAATATPTPQQTVGTVRGAVCRPDGFANAALTVYLLNTATNQVVSVPVAANQIAYELPLNPGTYVAYAWLLDGSLSGAYTEAVVCGLTAACTNHALRPVNILAGTITDSIDICDWSAEAVTVIPTPTVP